MINEKDELTHLHFDILKFIVEFKILYDGCAPSLREIQRACGVSSLSVLCYRLDVLEFHEKIKRIPNTSRGIMVVGGRYGILISHMID